MAILKTKKPKGPVTTKRRRSRRAVQKPAREWKIGTLSRLVDFAYDTRTDVSELASQFGSLIGETVPGIGIFVPRDWLDPAIMRSWLDTLHWGQDEAKAAIERAAQKQPWKLEMSRLLALAPGLTWQAIGASGLWETLPTDDNLKTAWLLAIKEILRFNQGWRIRRCVESNCNAVLVGRTTSHYCDRHSTSAEKSRRFRERNAKTMTPEQRKKRRQQYYENYLRKHKGEAVAAARRQRTKPTVAGDENS